jgi:hypothetical protein
MCMLKASVRDAHRYGPITADTPADELHPAHIVGFAYEHSQSFCGMRVIILTPDLRLETRSMGQVRVDAAPSAPPIPAPHFRR